MNMLEIHGDALESGTTVYHEFLLFYKKREKIVYGFVEGKDDPSFYRGIIDSKIPDDWTVRLVASGNKDKVIKAYGAMDWSRYPRNRICFFVDKDLSEFIGDDTPKETNVYITDGYSIENDIVNNCTFERTLKEIFDITEATEDEMAEIQRIFSSNIELFCKWLMPIMAQIILWRKAGKKPTLDKITVKDYVCFADGALELRDEYHDSAKIIQNVSKKCELDCSDDEEIKDLCNELMGKGEPKKYMRGKYLMWLFVQNALSVHESIARLCGKYTKSPKIRVTFGLQNALVQIAPRVRPPASLTKFIERTYLQYIDEVGGESDDRGSLAQESEEVCCA